MVRKPYKLAANMFYINLKRIICLFFCAFEFFSSIENLDGEIDVEVAVIVSGMANYRDVQAYMIFRISVSLFLLLYFEH